MPAIKVNNALRIYEQHTILQGPIGRLQHHPSLWVHGAGFCCRERKEWGVKCSNILLYEMSSWDGNLLAH